MVAGGSESTAADVVATETALEVTTGAAVEKPREEVGGLRSKRPSITSLSMHRVAAGWRRAPDASELVAAA